MGKVISFIVGTIFWLGMFESNLIKPLAVLPVSQVMDALFVGDYLLWIVSVLAVAGLSRLMDLWLASRRTRSAIR